MSMRYKGGILSATPPTTSTASAKGVWTIIQQMQAQAAGNWPSASGYQIQRSLRFNKDDTTQLTRTVTVAGDRQKFTLSMWVKRSQLGTTEQTLFCAPRYSGESGELYSDKLIFNSSDNLVFYTRDASEANVVTTQVFRDLSAWYHIVLAVDTTQATASNRTKLYVNGSQITAFSTASYQSLNYQGRINNTFTHTIGTYNNTSTSGFSGYITEVHFVDGQQLTPSSFGETNSNTGVWQPKQVTGMTYGTNGFYLNFLDNSNTTAATLGKDYSGNGNNWTPNNFSVTAGVGNDSLVDTPTSYGTDTGAGGEVRGNYYTLNPLTASYNTSYITYSNGNLQITKSSSTVDWRGLSSGLPATGKWYWEWTITALSVGDGVLSFGIADQQYGSGAFGTYFTNMYLYLSDARKSSSAGATSYGASFTANDVIGVAYDADNGSITFYKNGSSQGTAYTGISTSTQWYPAVAQSGNPSSGTYYVNFGQRAFAYTAPSGYKALVSQNLPTPTIGATSTTQANDYFTPYLYTGDGSNTRSLTGVGFQPDFTWSKARTSAYQHQLFDAVRGTGSTKNLQCASTAVEGTDASLYGYLTSFDTDGFSVSKGTDASLPYAWVNQNSTNYVVWNWKANGAGSSNTDGSLTATVSASTTSGFSIATFTTPASGTSTVGHGLGVAPSMIIFKARNGAFDWPVYHQSIGNTGYVLLNSTNAAATDSTFFNNTSPTSTVFTLGTAYANSKNYVAYCFAPVAGYSAFGSYTGNGSTDGTFVYTGFRPRYVLIKRIGAAAYWELFDTARSTYNVSNAWLKANASDAESTSLLAIDFVSNGFKLRSSDGDQNANSANYLYAAFAESPFKYALAR